jgi:hypothetical protein
MRHARVAPLSVPVLLSGLAMLSLVGVASAQPVNTLLGPGLTWQPLGSSSYDTGLIGTQRGGFNGQTTGPFTDTSFGVMDEPGTPWFTGADLTSQQYVQRQVFGNFGTSSPPGPAGFRHYNFGYGSTADGSNFPRTATEQRSVSVNHWNNLFPDAGGVASLNQIVWVPTAATLSVGLGWGGDEMLLKFIGGNSGQRSQFFVDTTLNASFSTTAFGAVPAANGSIRFNAVVESNDGGGGSYDVAFGLGASNVSGSPNISRVGALDGVFVNGSQVGEVAQGIPANSVGHGFTSNFNVLSSLLQDGTSFVIDFNGFAEINNLVRDFGNADARASLGPGLEGNARLVVTYTAFQAVPAPGAAGLLAGLGLLAARRRR